MSGTGVSQGFNLLCEQWIPVVFVNGSAGEVSILEALEDAPAIRELSGDIPQEVLPIIRLLLAVLYRSYSFGADDEEELLGMWADVWERGCFDEDLVRRYLDPIRSRFDLFDKEHPFFQVPGLAFGGKDPDPISELIADVPKPDKFLFSTRDRSRLDSISYAEAARWLVFMQAYDTAGIKSPVVGNSHVRSGKVYAPKGAAGTGLLGAEGGLFFEGANLFQTLMLNWVLFDPQRSEGMMLGIDCDKAPWERDDRGADLRLAGPDEPAGPVGWLTWQSRRVRLVRDESDGCVTGVVSCYGDITSVVDKQRVETMTAWRESPQQQKKLGTSYVPLMPRTHDSSRLLWQGLSSLISVQSSGETADLRPGVVRWVDTLRESGAFSDGVPVVTIHAQGMEYGTQSSVFTNGIDDAFSLPVSMLRYDSPECVKSIELIGQTDEAINALARFIYGVNKASGNRSAPKTIRLLQDGVRERAYVELDSIFKDRLAHFKTDVDVIEYCDEWRNEVHRRLLAMAEDYVASSDLSYFTEHDGMSVGKAFSWYKANLNKALGRLMALSNTPGPGVRGGSDGKKGE